MGAPGQDPWGKKGTRCGATSKQTGNQCRNPSTPGGKVCRFHGGGSKRAKEAFAKNLAEQKIASAIDTLNLDPIKHPLEELNKLAGEVVSWKNALRRHVEELQQLRYAGEAAEQIRGEIVLFERALDRCATVLGMIAKLNIDERLIVIEEAKATKIVDALEAVLDHLGLSVEQRISGKKEMARHLRAIG